MSVTIDPTVALVVIDLQKGLLDRPTVHPLDVVITRTAELARAFRRAGQPVVLVTATGAAPGRTAAGRRPSRTPSADWADVADGLDAQPADHRITKQRWGAFHDTGLHEHLSAAGVTQVVLAGVATSIGVESSARAAYEHGYNVVVTTDAMTDLDADAHHNSVERIFPRLGELATSAEIIALLDHG